MTNQLTNTTTLTMSSREIAELVELRHDNVKRTINTLVERGVIVRPQIEDEPSTDSLGRTRVTSVYLVGQRDSYVIVAQLSPEFTARLVDRWQELEAQAAKPVTRAFQDWVTKVVLPAIRQDAEGRYCLNDLHRAAGGHVNHQPNFFMKRNETAELLAELNSDNSLNYEAAVSKAGRYGGTFVVKELVYAYAMWISPAFHLKVIRANTR
jgi:phage regulator Rha-like protein